MNNLAYKTWGVRGRPPLVLLHGFLGDSDDWLSLVSLLENDLYLIAIDLPGHGNSRGVELDDVEVGGVEVKNQAAFVSFSALLDSTLKQLDLNRYNLLGYSLGGRLAMLHSLNQPESVQRLFLESSHPGLETDVDRTIRKLGDNEWAERFRHESLESVLQSWYHQPVFADLNSHQRQDLMEHRIRINRNGRLLGDVLASCSLSQQPACWAGLAQAPFLVNYLYGERDLKFTDIALRLHQSGCLEGAHKMVEAGHNVHREQPEAMANVIKHLLV